MKVFEKLKTKKKSWKNNNVGVSALVRRIYPSRKATSLCNSLIKHKSSYLDILCCLK